MSTKLSYAIYLTQFPIFFYNVGRRRHIHHYYNFVSTIVSNFILKLKEKQLKIALHKRTYVLSFSLTPMNTFAYS